MKIFLDLCLMRDLYLYGYDVAINREGRFGPIGRGFQRDSGGAWR